MKSLFKFLLYGSLLFLLIALHQSNYLIMPQIYSPHYLVISFIFLFMSFINSVMCWKLILKKNGINVRSRECFASVGLSIFGKYIPGKIWGIIGRAVYLRNNNALPLEQLSSISMDVQLINSWLGLIFGAFGLFLLGGLHIWGWIIFFLWLGITVIVFTNIAHSSTKYIINKILKKDIILPRLSIKSTLAVMPWFISYWALLSISFYMLVNSLTSVNVPLSVGLGFPLAGTLGVMAFIAPGGLGVREGVMTGYLSLVGLPVMIATSISVASRLWYFVGELFIFLVGWLSNKFKSSGLTNSFK